MLRTQTLKYEEIARANADDVIAVLQTLSEAEWDAQSLCEGWNVRHVVGHLIFGLTETAPRMVGAVRVDRFDQDRLLSRRAREIGDGCSSVALVERYVAASSTAWPRRVAGRLPMALAAADTSVHLLDICLPLHRESGLDACRLAAVLDILVDWNVCGARSRAAGLQLVATDIDWQRGTGPEACGSADRLILSLTGRRGFLHELSGSGVDLWASRSCTQERAAFGRAADALRVARPTSDIGAPC